MFYPYILVLANGTRFYFKGENSDHTANYIASDELQQTELHFTEYDDLFIGSLEGNKELVLEENLLYFERTEGKDQDYAYQVD